MWNSERMVEASKDIEKGIKSVGVLVTLFGEEFGVFAEDGLDGSEEELKIFKEVFYGASVGDAGKDECERAESSVSLNCGGSVVTSFSSKRDSSHEQASENTEVKFLSTVHQERKGTNADLLHTDSSKVIAHSSLEDFLQEELPCHVNGYCMFSSKKETDTSGNLHNGVKSKYKGSMQPVGVAKIVDGKSVTSPNSQESVDSGFVASAGFAPAGTPGALICIKESVQESANLAMVHTAPKRPTSRVPPPLLESYAHCLLVDAGWTIESRARIDRKKAAYYFTKPEGGRALKALTAAWKACGEILLLTASDSERDENGREWTDVNMFWRDMTDTLAYIDKAAHHQYNSLSLLHRWQLLDPFMAMVWIDKKVGALRAGTALRAANSTTFVLSQSNKTILPDMVAQWGNSTSGELSLCSSGSLTSGITPVLQKSLVLEGSCNDIHSSKRCLRAEQQCPCCTELHKKSTKSLGRRIGKGLFDQECLNLGSKGSISRRKRSKRSAGRSTFTQNDSVYSFYCHSEQENLCIPEETSDLRADVNSRERMLAPEDTPDAVRLVNTRSELQSCAFLVSPHGASTDFGGDSNMGLPIYQDMSPVLQEDPNLAENIFSTKDTNSDLMRTSAPKIVDVPTKKVRKKSKKISEIEATGVSDQCGHDKSGEAFDLSTVSSICDMVGLVDHIERTDSMRRELSSQCFGELDNLEEHVDDFQHASCIEQAHVPTEIDILKKPSDAKAKLWGRKKKSDLTMPVEEEQAHTLSKEDTKYNTLMKDECKAKRLNFHRSYSTSSKRKKLDHESNKVQNRIKDHEISADEDITARVFPGKNISDEVLANGSVSPEFRSHLNIMKDSKPEGKMKTGGKKPRRICIKDDELLITAFFKKNFFSSSGKSSASKVRDSQAKALGKLKSEKGSCRLLPRVLGKGGKLTKDGNRFIMGARTVLCWLIEMGSVSIKDTVQFRNPKNDVVVKDGWVTREGILCNCCSKILSVSEFKAHAGFKQQRPPLSLFMQSDKPYTLCQLQAWSTEYKLRKSRMQVMGAEGEDKNDDTCALCGDGGDLVCCDNCPSTYHQSCLSAQELPEGSWYCPNCVCMSCGDVADGKEASNSLSVFECSQCRHKYHQTCIKRRLPCNVELGSSEWFCGEGCQEVYLGFRSRVGVVNHIADGFAWTILRCSHVDQKVGSKQKIALMAECNAKLAIALTLMEECFVPMVDPTTGIDMIPHVLYNWGSKFARLDYQGFYAVVLERGDVLVSVASIRLHGVTVAEMPLIATCSGHRRKGMCKLLLDAIEKLLISLKVKMLVLSAIPSLVETWTSGFGFGPIEDEEKKQLANVNLMKFPGTVLLKKNLHEDSADRSGNVDLQSTGDQFQINGESLEMTNTSSGKLSFENHQSDPRALSSFPAISVLPVKQVDCGQDILTTYGESSLSTSWHSEHGGGSIEDSCVRIANFNTDGMDHSFLSGKAVDSQVYVANVSTIAHSCIVSLTSLATNGKVSSNPSFNNHDVITMDREDKTSQEASTFAEDADAVAMSNKRVSPRGDEEHRILVDASSQVISLSDRQTQGDPHLATVNQVPVVSLYSKSHDVTICHIEENLSQTANILCEVHVPETTNNERRVYLKDADEHNSSVGASEAKESAQLAASNLNKMKLGGTVTSWSPV